MELNAVGVDIDHESLDDVGRLDGHVAGIDGVIVVAHGAHEGGEEAGGGILDDGGLQLPQRLGLRGGHLDLATVVGHAQPHQSVAVGCGIALIGHGIEFGTILGVLGHNQVGVVNAWLGHPFGLDAGIVLLGYLIEIGGVLVGIGRETAFGTGNHVVAVGFGAAAAHLQGKGGLGAVVGLDGGNGGICDHTQIAGIETQILARLLTAHVILWIALVRVLVGLVVLRVLSGTVDVGAVGSGYHVAVHIVAGDALRRLATGVGFVAAVVVAVEHDEVGILAKRLLQQLLAGRRSDALRGLADAVAVAEGHVEGEEDGLVGVVSIDLGQLVGHPLHGLLGVDVVPGTLEEVLAAVKDDEVEAVDDVVEGSQQTHGAQTAVVSILVESLVGGQFADVVLHGEGIVVACVVGLRDVVPVGHLVVVVAGDVDDGRRRSGREGLARILGYELTHLPPIGHGDCGVAGAVAPQQHHVDLLGFLQLGERLEERAAQGNVAQVSTVDERALGVDVGDAGQRKQWFFLVVAVGLCMGGDGRQRQDCQQENEFSDHSVITYL